MIYEIMHRENCVAQISTVGECKIYLEDFMPYDLMLEESNDFDKRIKNAMSFYSWCASRMIPPDRTYAKEILNSIGAPQSVTDRERAQIALSYHCLSLLDVFWVKEENEKIRFEDINLFAHSLSNALVDIALRGHQMTVTNAHLLANDLSTGGLYPRRGCEKRMASIFTRMAAGKRWNVKCWQAKSAGALTAIRYCMSRGCLKMSRFLSAKS